MSEKLLTLLNLCFYSSLSVLFTGLIEEDLQRSTNCSRRLQPIHQVVIALQFYATGTYQNTVGNNLRVSQPSVSRAIDCVSKALCSIAPTHIKFPEDLGAVSTFVL